MLVMGTFVAVYHSSFDSENTTSNRQLQPLSYIIYAPSLETLPPYIRQNKPISLLLLIS